MAAPVQLEVPHDVKVYPGSGHRFLSEASGAGVATLLLRAALACHAGMATFAEAGVSGADK